ncbi:MAG: hypothetical protein R2838_00595 [Caldilineaceae bacterium]
MEETLAVPLRPALSWRADRKRKSQRFFGLPLYIMNQIVPARWKIWARCR